MQPDVTMVRNQLMECYREAMQKNGLIDFVKSIRTPNNDNQGKYSVSPSDLDTLFSAAVWNEAKTGNGHRKLTNVITKTVVEYRNHDNSGGIDPGAALSICDNIQTHLNILCNQIFQYTTHQWKTTPDYDQSVQRYIDWANQRISPPRKSSRSA